MRWISLQYTLVGYHAGFEAGTASATTARDAANPVRTWPNGWLETRAGVVARIVSPVAAWTAARVAIWADRLRPLLAAPACP